MEDRTPEFHPEQTRYIISIQSPNHKMVPFLELRKQSFEIKSLAGGRRSSQGQSWDLNPDV